MATDLRFLVLIKFLGYILDVCAVVCVVLDLCVILDLRCVRIYIILDAAWVPFPAAMNICDGATIHIYTM